MPLPYFGGKGKAELGGWLFKNFDLSGINNYIEPFSGMSGIYLGKFSDFSGVKNIIYNDIDKQNCNVFNCIQMPLNFLNEIHNSFQEGGLFYTIHGTSYEEKYQHYKSIYMDYHNGVKVLPNINLQYRDYRTAVIYSFLRLTSMKQLHFIEGGFKEFSMEDSWYKRYKFFQPLVNKLINPELTKKVARMSIYSSDFQDIMNVFNTPDSFIYIDPPYYNRELLYDPNKKGVFTIEDHGRLARAVSKSKARIAISYYYFDSIFDLYPTSQYRYKRKTVRNNAGGDKATELLIMNY